MLLIILISGCYNRIKTTKYYSSSSDSQMSEIGIYGVVKSLVRKYKIKWRHVIYTRRNQKIQIRKEILFISWDEYS